MAQVSILIPTDQLWPHARGGSLKITASPSVTALPFRSHMLLKKQQRITERIHNIFLSPFLALCAPPTAFPGPWMAPAEHNVMRKRATASELRLPAVPGCTHSPFFLCVDSSRWKMNQISGNVIYIYQKGTHIDAITPLKYENVPVCVEAPLGMISFLARDHNNPTVTKTFR